MSTASIGLVSVLTRVIWQIDLSRVSGHSGLQETAFAKLAWTGLQKIVLAGRHKSWDRGTI